MRFLTFVAVALLSLVSADSWAVPEADLMGRLETEILPFHDQTVRRGHFKGEDDISIAYSYFQNPENRGTIVIVPGRAEPARKYAEVIWDLHSEGFSVFVYDHRGQGESGRMTLDAEVGFVRQFEDYVEDLAKFTREIVQPWATSPLHLIAHSMGGAIATRYLATNPGQYRSATLISPMLQLDTKPYTEPVAFALLRGLVLMGRGHHLAPGQSAYNPKLPFSENEATLSEARFTMQRRILELSPHLTVGGASNRWVLESLRVTSEIRKQWVLQIRDPVLVLQAGDDRLITKSANEPACARIQRCEYHEFDGAYHELLMERDPIRNRILGWIKDFVVHH